MPRCCSVRFATLMLALSAVAGCARTPLNPGSTPAPAPRDAQCPATRKAARPLPSVTPERLTLGYWLERADGDPDQVLLSAAEIRRHRAALLVADEGKPLGQIDLWTAPSDTHALQPDVQERLAYLQEKLRTHAYVDKGGHPFDVQVIAELAPPDPLPPFSVSWHHVQTLTALHCAPSELGYYTEAVDLDFNRNTCSTLRPGELVQVLSHWPNGMRLARTAYALGWLPPNAALSAPLDDGTVAALAAEHRSAPRDLSRRALLKAAFEFVGGAYGWAGRGGGHDCSRFLMDLFAQFGIDLPRHSAMQARAGSFSIDVTDVDGPQKTHLIAAAARRGIVLLQLPGHIMLYLGTSEDGVPMAMHAFSEFLTPCADGHHETVNRVDEVTVSDLSLGAGSSRRDFLSRITTLTVFGPSPGRELEGAATVRQAAPPQFPAARACDDSPTHAIFRSPARPNRHQLLRLIAASDDWPGSASLWLRDPRGAVRETVIHRLGGPPYGQWTEVAEPTPGAWTALWADGDRVLACERFRVWQKPAGREGRSEPGPAWIPTWRWDRDTENLFSLFIEQLFLQPDADDTTWPNLQTLTRDPTRNLLFDHRTPGEDASIALAPDCADLPYFLRAYFAYKLRLPFAFSNCSRGSARRAPLCVAPPLDNLYEVTASDEVDAFNQLLKRVASTVHSASARVAPQSKTGDVYPLALRRDALRPGSIYADPYGHLLMVARWRAQDVRNYGMLVGADAQPDGTVGRRRFWRGSFLFDPATDRFGAGFKGWRPVSYDGDAQRIAVASNETIRARGDFYGWSLQQYETDVDGFYAQMEALINPRPLDPVAMQHHLIDALQEAVQRRVVSVANGEAFVRDNAGKPIKMPTGYSIFETQGPWEDFSTPSRDMRLLISLDAVTRFPDRVAAAPARFGLSAAQAAAGSAQVRAVLQDALAARTFRYTRSDGREQTLTLADLAARVQALEVAYNPNDCIEIRWGAAEGSAERATCQRRAPSDQQALMRQYRPWFAARKRPPRD